MVTVYGGKGSGVQGTRQGDIMERKDEETFVITETTSGRTYIVHRRNRAHFRGIWDVCNEGGGRYGTFATLPGARRWARSN